MACYLSLLVIKTVLSVLGRIASVYSDYILVSFTISASYILYKPASPPAPAPFERNPRENKRLSSAASLISLLSRFDRPTTAGPRPKATDIGHRNGPALGGDGDTGCCLGSWSGRLLRVKDGIICHEPHPFVRCQEIYAVREASQTWRGLCTPNM